MNYNWLNRVGSISCWVVVVPLIYFLAAPFLVSLLTKLPDPPIELEEAAGVSVEILLSPGFALYGSV